MPQTKSCRCRTINLAKEGHTKEERRCKMLIYEKRQPAELPFVCGPPVELGLRENHPSAKRVRVCTAADIRTTCPPPVCTCPVAQPPTTFLQMLKKAGMFGVKAAIVYGVVYVSYQAGMWSDAKTSECLYVELKNIASGTDYTCMEEGAPRTDLIMHDLRQKYNHLVSCAFSCTTDLINKVKSAMAPKETQCCKDSAGDDK